MYFRYTESFTLQSPISAFPLLELSKVYGTCKASKLQNAKSVLLEIFEAISVFLCFFLCEIASNTHEHLSVLVTNFRNTRIRMFGGYVLVRPRFTALVLLLIMHWPALNLPKEVNSCFTNAFIVLYMEGPEEGLRLWSANPSFAITY